MTTACSSRSGAVPAQPALTPQQRGTPTSTAEPPPDVAPEECALIALPGEPISTVGLAERVDPANAPRPTNPSERLLFSHLYETLVRVDCMGRVRPALASSWRLDEKSGFLWIVTLRENARFSDGTPVTAANVRASWIREGIDSQFPTYVSRLVGGVNVIDDRTLIIQISTFQPEAPVALAHPSLAVVRRVADSPWPLGTRSNRLEPGSNDARTGGRPALTVSRNDLPPLRFLAAPGDPRDLLDAGVDLLLTHDPATLDYAATLQQFQRLPLPWQRTHVFLTAGRSAQSPVLSDEARQALAKDAVRGEARGAQGPFWFTTAQCHGRPQAGIRPHTPTTRVVYDANDGVARDLAERFVGLAGAPGPAATTLLDALLPDRPRRAFQRAVGLTGAELANARRDGTDAGYVVPVESRPLEPCHELEALKESVPWVGPWTIVPLVDTRLQAVVRRGRSGLAADFDGSALIEDVNAQRSR